MPKIDHPLGKGALVPLAAPLQAGHTFPRELVPVGGRPSNDVAEAVNGTRMRILV